MNDELRTVATEWYGQTSGNHLVTNKQQQPVLTLSRIGSMVPLTQEQKRSQKRG